jgi:branched-chain amino acid transport system substrate-binding protein
MESVMKKMLMTIVASSMFVMPTLAEEAKIGILFGFTGPTESHAPSMAAGAELAINEAKASGNFMRGMKITPVRADSTCIDNAAAAAAAERLITSDRINGIIGADCSGATIAVLQNVSKPYGVVMISPSSTTPALSTIEDNGLFFRTAPSDARQGQVIAEILRDSGYKSVAMTYTNNDYGKGLADSIEANFIAAGGAFTIIASHEDGKPDNSAEVATLAQAGGDILIVAGYVDQGGKNIIQEALDTGAFDRFFLPGNMVNNALPVAIGPDLDGSIGTVPGTDNPSAAMFVEQTKAAGFVAGPFSGESYDAAALMIMAMQAASSTDSQIYKNKIMDVANAPGIRIHSGELGKALKVIAEGGDVDYVGASAIELIDGGESAGSYAQIEVRDGENTIVRYR